MLSAFEVTYQGKKQPMMKWADKHNIRDLAGLGPDDTINFRDLINVISGICLSKHFADQAPEYPKFSVLVTSENRAQATEDALSCIAKGSLTKQATAVLDALELLDGDRISPDKSRYANHILDLMKAKGKGQVVNRSEIIQDVQGVEYLEPSRFRLEPEWAVVVLASLVYSGDLVLTVTGGKFEPANLSAMAATDIEQLVHFKHIQQPSGWPVAALKALFDLMGLAPGNATSVTQGKGEPVADLQAKVHETVNRLVIAQKGVQEGFPCWGQPVLSEQEREQASVRLGSLKHFLEGLQPFNTPGKFRNFKSTREEVEAQRAGQQALAEAESLQGLLGELASVASYLTAAENVLPAEHPWLSQEKEARTKLLAALADTKKRSQSSFRGQTLQQLRTLKSEYVKAYSELHSKARLGAKEDKRKQQLMKDERLSQLQELSTIDLMPVAHLRDFQNSLAELRPCFNLTTQDLEETPVCPHCDFRPVAEQGTASAKAALDSLDDRLDELHSSWTQTLLDNLEDPTTQENLELLPEDAQGQIQSFIDSKELPDDVDDAFIKAITDALKGLVKVVMRSDAMRAALLSGGSPASPNDLRARFEQHLNELTKGKDVTKVRIVLE